MSTHGVTNSVCVIMATGTECVFTYDQAGNVETKRRSVYMAAVEQCSTDRRTDILGHPYRSLDS